MAVADGWALLGGDAEVTRHDRRTPCPSPTDGRLLVANLSHGAGVEFLVVNPARSPLALDTESPLPADLEWRDAQGLKIPGPGSILVQQRSWASGRTNP